MSKSMNVRRLLLLVLFTTPLSMTGAQPIRNSWTLPPRTTITRDPQALQILQKVVDGARLAQGPPLADFSVAGQVTMWGGKTVTGSFSHMGIGTENRFTRIAVDDKEVYRFTSMADSGTARTSDGKLLTLSTEMTMESDYYMLIPLLQEAINSNLIEVEYIRSATESLESGHVRIIRHREHWRPSMREFGSAQFDIFVDPSGNTVSRISNRSHFDGVMNHSVEHSLIFSDYHAESGWLVPHNIEERYVGKTLNRLTLTSFAFNNNLKTSDFAAQ